MEHGDSGHGHAGDDFTLEGHGTHSYSFDGYNNVSNGLTCMLLVLAGVCVPLSLRMMHSRAASMRSAGRLLCVFSAGLVSVAAGMWDSNSESYSSLPMLGFLPYAGLLVLYSFFADDTVRGGNAHVPGALLPVKDDKYVPLSLSSGQDYFTVAIIAIGMYCPLFGLYAKAGVMESTNFVGNVFGHLLPGSFVALSSQFGLHYFRRNNDLLGFQRLEALIMLVFGSVALTMHTLGNRGSIFIMLWGGEDHNWMKDEQHFMDVCIWIVAGAVGYFFYSIEYVTGVHVLLPAITNAVAMSMHPQPTRLLALMHWSFGGITLIAALFRLSLKLPEYCIFAALGGLSFVMATPELGLWGATVFAPSSYFLFVVILITSTWVYNAALWCSPVADNFLGPSVAGRNTMRP